MSFEKLLQYQEIDIQLRRILDVIEKNDDQKKIVQAKKEFASAKKTIEESEAAAAQLVEFFSTAQKYYQDTVNKIEELSAALEPNNHDPEVLIQQLGRLKGRLSELETKVNERRMRSDKVVRAYLDANERGRKMRDIHGRAKDRQDALYKAKEPEINALKQKLAEIEPQINADLIKSYHAITSEHKYPAFVEAYADGKTYSCKGCGLALSQTASTELVSNGRCVCESCRRVIYKK